MKKIQIDHKKERGKLIDSLQLKIQESKKLLLIKEKKEPKSGPFIDTNVNLFQRLIIDLERLNEFDTYDLKKLEIIKGELNGAA